MNKTTLIKSRRTRAAQVKKQSAHRISSPQGKRQKNAKWKRLAGACLVSCFVVFVIVCIYGSFRIHNKVVNQVKDYRENSNQKASTTTSSRKDAIIRSLEKGQPAAAPSTSAGSSTGKILLKIFGSPFCSGNVEEAKMESTGPLEYTPTILPKSVQVYGAGLVEVYNGPKQEYKGTVMELEGCVDFYDLMEKQESKFVLFTEATVDKVLTSKQQIPKQLQESFATTKDLSKPHTRFVFSATSSEYFGYQVSARD